jgi:cytochrome c biogenesis protein CcmG/thiol:disulfide interchange protein DsbE
MKDRIRISGQDRFTVFSLLVLVFCAGWIWFSRVQPGNAALQNNPAPREGFLAPGFTLESHSGEKFDLEDQKGKVLLINFWTTWCPPCRAEMPAIQRVYTDYQDEGLVVIGINATDQDELTSVKSFITENQLTFPILLDNDGEISRKYNLHSLPTSFFVDQNGIIQDVVIGGPMAEALLRSRVERLLEGAK